MAAMTTTFVYSAETAALVLLLSAATYLDLRRHRIPNALTFGGALLGLALQTSLLGFDGFLTSLGGFGIGLAVLLPFYLLGGMGAGDVKLMGAVGTFLGIQYALLATALTLIVGGILAMLVLLARRGTQATLRRYGLMAKTLLLTGHVSYVPPAADEAAATRFPYAVAIALGTMGIIAWLGP